MNKQLVKPGDKIFYVNPNTGWAIGTLTEYGDQKVKVEDGETYTVKTEETHPHMDGAYDKEFYDLFQMGDLHQATLLYCLKGRYEDAGMMYTRMGEIVISINPFQAKDYNHPDCMNTHTKGKWEHPHVWEIAYKAYRKIIIMDRRNQSVLVSGESGAGKTETAKTLIDYLGKMSSSHSCNSVQKGLAEQVNKRLRASNPILESFGNAKTTRNDNSSRFGKYIKLYFDRESGVLIGAQMVHYLLEKSRIVTQNEGERGYHVFYELLAGFTDEQKEKYGKLTKSGDYGSLNKGNQLIRELNGRITDDGVQYKHLMQAFKDTEISDDEQDAIFRVIGAILNLQNVSYVTDEGSGKAKIENPDIADRVSGLLQVDTEKFRDALLVKSRTKIGVMMADVAEAQDMRDALSKALYSGVFDWLVHKLNKVIAPAESMMKGDVRYVGLLDIFGFENFKINSFEQFCINYTNESLQNHYNKYTFIMDQEECNAEGIECPTVDYPDNQPCLDMLQAKGGIMPLLDAQCAFKLGTDAGFTEEAWKSHGESQFFNKPRSSVADRFGVNHYAASVNYMTAGWLEKNSDTLKDDMRHVCNASSSEFVAGLLGPVVEEKQGQKKPTVSSKFREQLEELKTELNSTDSHFIRTVKPNPQMKPGYLENGYVMAQLTSAGVIETIIMKRAGFPVRQLHKDFWLRYRIIAPKAVREKYPPGQHPSEADLPQVCRDIASFWCDVVWSVPKPNFDIGHTKVFTKAKVNENFEICRSKKCHRLLPRCTPYLIRWIIDFRRRKAEEEERRRREEEEARKRMEENERRRAAGEVVEEASKMDDEKGRIFTKMCNLFPHFELSVILYVVEGTPGEKKATDVLLDMQKQRVSDTLPVTVKTIFEKAKLSLNTQEELLKRGVTDRDKLYTITTEQMKEMKFSEEERDNLAEVLLHQQSEWVVNQRLNLLIGAENRDDEQIKKDLEMLEKAAQEIKKDLEGHLAGKFVGQDIALKSTRKVPPPPEEQVARFVGMGFSREKALAALKKAKNNPEKACDYLLRAK